MAGAGSCLPWISGAESSVPQTWAVIASATTTTTTSAAAAAVGCRVLHYLSMYLASWRQSSVLQKVHFRADADAFLELSLQCHCD